MNYELIILKMPYHERSLLTYVCDCLRAAPKKALLTLKYAYNHNATMAYHQIVQHLMTVPLDEIELEEKRLRVALT